VANSKARTGGSAKPASPKTAKKAAKSFAKGEKKLGRAQEQVTGQDADGALKNLGKAAAAVEKGVLLLVPQPFPEP